MLNEDIVVLINRVIVVERELSGRALRTWRPWVSSQHQTKQNKTKNTLKQLVINFLILIIIMSNFATRSLETC
jgi:hypothetical protein